jgi:hypothetical protein
MTSVMDGWRSMKHWWKFADGEDEICRRSSPSPWNPTLTGLSVLLKDTLRVVLSLLPTAQGISDVEIISVQNPLAHLPVLWQYLAEFFPEWEMFQIRVLEKIKTHISFNSITFRSNQMHYFYYLKLKTIYKFIVLSFK